MPVRRKRCSVPRPTGRRSVVVRRNQDGDSSHTTRVCRGLAAAYGPLDPCPGEHAGRHRSVEGKLRAGAWRLGRCVDLEKIIPLLRDAGHEVYAGINTGMGDRVHLADPAIDLDTYVTDFVNLLEFEELTDVTLVGWSYGGMTITGVAERVPERLAQLIYLDAFVPADGESFYDAFLVPPEARAA